MRASVSRTFFDFNRSAHGRPCSIIILLLRANVCGELQTCSGVCSVENSLRCDARFKTFVVASTVFVVADARARSPYEGDSGITTTLCYDNNIM